MAPGHLKCNWDNPNYSKLVKQNRFGTTSFIKHSNHKWKRKMIIFTSKLKKKLPNIKTVLYQYINYFLHTKDA